MTRVLMIRPGPAFAVADVYRGWQAALKELGCAVADLNYDDRLSLYSRAGLQSDDGEFLPLFDEAGAILLAQKSVLAACYEGDPDIVLIVSGFYVSAEMLDTMARHTTVVLLHTESPYEDDRQLALAGHATLNIVNDPTNLDRFNALAPTIYLPHAYDPAVHCPGPFGKEYQSDFAMVGTGFPSRVSFLEAVDWSGIDVALAGNWQTLTEGSPLRPFVAHDIENCCDNAEAVLLYRGTKASANLYRREANKPELAAGWAMGPREVELAACGTFYLTEERGENRQILPMVPVFQSPGDFEDRLRWYLTHPTERQRIVDLARAAIAGRTFVNNATQMLHQLYRSP